MNMLDVRSLYVTYLSEEERVEAVRGIDFSAEEGKVTGIVGESGSGKSTAMLAVMGLLDHKAAVEAEKVSLFGNTVRAGDNAAIIFQDPLKCLNPTVKIGRQPRLCGIGKNVHGGRQRKDRKNYWIRLVSATPG